MGVTAARDPALPQPVLAGGGERAALLAFLLYVALFAAAAAAFRGVWTDELWSLWMGLHDPSLPPVPARWTSDTHPPLFSAGTWLLQPIVGLDVTAWRLLNFSTFLYPVLVGWALGRRSPQVAAFALVLIPLVASSPAFANNIAEYRAYFPSLAFSTALSILLYRISAAETDLRWRTDRRLAGFAAVTILIALNLHYISAFICGTMVAAVAIASWLRGKRGWFALLIASAAVAAVPLAASYLSQRAFVASLDSFWITTTPPQAAVAVARALLGSTGLNLVAIGFAGFGSLLIWRGGPAALPWSRTYPAAIAAGLLVAAAVLIGINFIRPVVIERHLIALIPFAAGVIAALAAPLLQGRRWAYLLLLANAAAVVAPLSLRAARSDNWHEGARIVAREVEACPRTLVHAAYELRPRPGHPPNQLEIVRWAMPHLGRRFGFAVIFHERLDGRPLPRSPAPCPTIVWAEHNGGLVPPNGQLAAMIGLGDAAAAANMRVLGTNSGTVAILPPIQ